MYGDNGIDHTVLFLIYLPILFVRMPFLKLARKALMCCKILPRFKSSIFNEDWEIVGSYDENIG